MSLLTGWIVGGAVALAIVIPLHSSPAAAILIGLACGSVGVWGAYRLWPR